ncbi:MAG: hypothetical protein ACXVPU_02280 [Bacteroidia bacterium]
MKSIYPQYRKYLNDKGYFKIISSTQWEEIQIVGNKYILHQFTVNIMPDRNFIYDLTFDYKNNWTAIEEEEYEMVKKRVL